ncbi:hypothetical protein E2320_004615, partial [Naja naja]
ADASTFPSARRAPAPPSPATAPARARELTLKRTPSTGDSSSPAQPTWPARLGDHELTCLTQLGFQRYRQPLLPYTAAAPPPAGHAFQAESAAWRHPNRGCVLLPQHPTDPESAAH